jgi:hypothetical protein
MQEVAGILDVLKDDIREICKYLCPADVGSIEEIQRVIYNAFKLKKIDKQLPFLHIQAAINAFIRYNKMQRFKINDLIDISHASWALAYCNAFFTERRLASWICNPLLNLQQIYQTSVLYKEEKVLNYLSCI